MFEHDDSGAPVAAHAGPGACHDPPQTRSRPPGAGAPAGRTRILIRYQAFEQAGVVTIVGDWTVRDEAITQFLTQQGAAGVPLYLWYAPGASAPQQLPQVLTADLLVAQASRN